MPSQISQNLSVNMNTGVTGPEAGSGSDKAAVQLADAKDISPYNAEIDAALKIFQEWKLPGPPAASAKTFPLPTLGPVLRDAAKDLHDGPGFVLLRGFPAEKYSNEDIMTIFLGIGSHIGSQRGSQNKARNVISHITDAKEWQNVPAEKRHGIHTNSALPFHNDMGCEILTLLYRQVAASGGATSLASAAAIYNDLLKQPEVLETLKKADWSVQLSSKPPRFQPMPLLAEHNGHIIISADPGRLGLHPKTGEKPSDTDNRLTEAQTHALEVLNSLAEKHALSVPAQAGDILLINNLAFLHKRDSYVDDDEAVANGKDEGTTNGKTEVTANGDAATKRRWLMRLWLRNKDLSWGVPESMKTPWEAAYGTEFGRFIEEKYDPTPQPDYKVPRYTSGTAAWLMEDDEEA
ncbi:hypothetical protein KVR01_008141 [Diaporthe batatas]|uniref:uncharacterized protein n=1 Tax=Diaporthe batatas TaxID=748121 RepID=UPI001D0374A9|nr:uncharacterized protein KVR01_008141 [Diaporthe batatas]KAG8162376.1 hypothetical protein KVR01_008141 [Diaporthe batatas]